MMDGLMIFMMVVAIGISVNNWYQNELERIRDVERSTKKAPSGATE